MKTKYARTDSVLFVIYGSNNLIGYCSLFYFTLLLESLGEITMGEALIWYRKRGGVDPELLKPQTITQNGTYTAPVDGTYTVYCIAGGGGGGGSCSNLWNQSQTFYGNGGYGFASYGNINLNAGEEVTISIGLGGNPGQNFVQYTRSGTWISRGNPGNAGGTTSFGTKTASMSSSGGQNAYQWVVWSNTPTWNNQPVYNNIGWYCNTCGRAMVYQSGPYYPNFYGMNLYSNKWIDDYNMQNGWFSGRYKSNGGRISGFEGVQWVLQCSYCGGPSQSMQYRDVSHSDGTWTEWWMPYPQSHYILRLATDVRPSNFGDMNMELTGGGWFSTFYYKYKLIQTGWRNVIQSWSNISTNYTWNCFSSIQQGNWIYQNTSNEKHISSHRGILSGFTRMYNGDGGQSGQKGNNGMIVIFPPQQQD